MKWKASSNGLAFVAATAVLAVADAQAEHSGVGLVLPPPSGRPWSALISAADPSRAEWNIFHNGSDIVIAHVSTCSNAINYASAVMDFMMNTTTSIQLGSPDDACGTEQNFQMAGGMSLNGAFAYNPALLKNVTEKRRQVPTTRVMFKPDNEFTWPRGFENGYSPVPNFFHHGDALMEFTAEASYAVQDLLKLRVSLPEVMRGFLVVKEEVHHEDPYMDWSNYTDPAELCKKDCSCAKRYIRDAVHESKYRRRLSRKLSTCTSLGDNPMRYGDSPCCNEAVKCDKDWFNDGHYFTRCAASQMLCDQMKWKDDSDDTQDPLEYDGHDDRDGPIPFLNETWPEFQSVCGNTPECVAAIQIWFEFYERPNATLSTLEQYLSAPPQDATSPFLQTVRFVVEFVRTMFIMMEQESGSPVEPDKCSMEVDKCFYNTMCRHKMLIKLALMEKDQALLHPRADDLAPTPEERDEGIVIFANYSSCMNITVHNMPGDGDGKEQDGVFVTLPIDSIPCACGNGTASFNAFETASVTPEGLKRDYTFELDMCFLSPNQPVGAVHLQRARRFGMEERAFNGVSQWTLPTLNLSPEQASALSDCWKGRECLQEAEMVKMAVYDTFAPRDIVLGSRLCGEQAQTYESQPETGRVRTCREVSIQPWSDALLNHFVSTGQFPSGHIRFHSLHNKYMENIGSEMNWYEVQYLLSLESHGTSLNPMLSVMLDHSAKSTMLLYERPVVSDGVDDMNCQATCECSRLYLQRVWDDKFSSMPPEHHSLPLQVPEAEVPCACSPTMDNARHQVHLDLTRTHDAYGYEQKFIRTTFGFCSDGLRAISLDYNGISAYNIPDKFSYVCDCHDHMQHSTCVQMCRMVRGPWAWTCDEFEGSALIGRDSQEANNLRSQCFV